MFAVTGSVTTGSGRTRDGCRGLVLRRFGGAPEQLRCAQLRSLEIFTCLETLDVVECGDELAESIAPTDGTDFAPVELETDDLPEESDNISFDFGGDDADVVADEQAQEDGGFSTTPPGASPFRAPGGTATLPEVLKFLW